MTLRNTLGLVILAIICTIPSHGLGAVRQLECREWIDGQYNGLYAFTFDTTSKRFSVRFEPAREWPLSGQRAESWNVLYENELNLVVGAADSGKARRFIVFGLDFGNVQMSAYELGSEWDSVILSKIERKCARTD